MFTDRAFPAVASAATLVGASIVVLGQAVFNPFADTVERMVGGSVLLAAAWLIIRWTFRLIREVREIAEDERNAAKEREAQLLARLTASHAQLAEVNAQLSQERQLRLSLEQMGLKDRRSE